MADADPSLVRYFVRQGDFLTKLAHRHGFTPADVWGLPENADLKATRPNMDILLPGDVVYFPAKPRDGLPLATGGANSFQTKRPNVKVSLVISEDGKPLANASYIVRGLMEPVLGSTTGDGRFSIDVPVDTRRIELYFPERHEIYPILIGHLDPTTERSGAVQRLRNLGYLGHYFDPEEAADDAYDEDAGESPFARALSDFQTDHSLTVTGALDADTARALESKHGS